MARKIPVAECYRMNLLFANISDGKISFEAHRFPSHEVFPIHPYRCQVESQSSIHRTVRGCEPVELVEICRTWKVGKRMFSTLSSKSWISELQVGRLHNLQVEVYF